MFRVVWIHTPRWAVTWHTVNTQFFSVHQVHRVPHGYHTGFDFVTVGIHIMPDVIGTFRAPTTNSGAFWT
ncbi:Uncharacterised protein [Vibrio cholerae]|nr:Uncharacterised protein [Vibrio cholerae]